MRNLLIGAGVALGILMGGSISLIGAQPKSQTQVQVQPASIAQTGGEAIAQLKQAGELENFQRYACRKIEREQKDLDTAVGAISINLSGKVNATATAEAQALHAILQYCTTGTYQGTEAELKVTQPQSEIPSSEVEKPAIEVKAIAPKEVGGFEPSDLQIAFLKQTGVQGATLIRPKAVKIIDPPSNLRSQPVKGNNVVHQFKQKGETVIAIAYKGDWFLVHNTNGRIKGWLHKSQIC